MALNREQSIELGFVIEERRAALLKEIRDDVDVNELRTIEAARDRISDGSYGECNGCGADIDYRRLRAAPSALRCIDCQRQYEKTHGGDAQGPAP